MWPRNKLDIGKRLSQLTEGISELIAEKTKDEPDNTKEVQGKTEEKPEEYSGIDPITYIEYKNGKETHFRIQI